MKKVFALTAASIVTAMILAACGGSSSPTVVAPTTLSGTTATGAPFIGATITVSDKSGVVGTTNTVNADGTFSVTLSPNAVFPVVLTAVRDDQTLVSVASENTTTNVNITPITNLIAARLASSGDPSKLADEITKNPGVASSDKVNAKVDEVIALLKNLLDAVGSTTNPLSGKFLADGSGLDRALDSLIIKIVPSSASSSNIEVSIKQGGDDATAPVVIKFTNTETPKPLPAPTALIKPGTAILIADLLKRITACYALPAGSRVTTADPSSTSPAETAADVIATACREIFFGSDPSTYLSNGRVVGSNAAFSSLFRSSATGLTFDRGTYEFTRVNTLSTNGDVVIGYRATDSLGNVTFDALAVRADNATTPTKFQIIGNQYQYSGGVSPYEQLRSFVKNSANDYYSTGYVLNVRKDSTISKVIVTTPKGGTLTLLPKSGFGDLQLSNDGTTPLSTNFVRIRSEYVDPAKASSDPATADTNLFFTTDKPSDADVSSYNEQSVWKFDYYLTSAPTVIAATQSYRTRARALSIGELKQKILPNLTDSNISNIVAATGTNNSFPAPTTAPVTLDWLVPDGGIAPTFIGLFGSVPNTAPSTGFSGFNDSARVGSTLRSGSISCFSQSSTDKHCTAGNYASTSRINGIHLIGVEPTGREFAHFYATYTITP